MTSLCFMLAAERFHISHQFGQMQPHDYSITFAALKLIILTRMLIVFMRGSLMNVIALSILCRVLTDSSFCISFLLTFPSSYISFFLHFLASYISFFLHFLLLTFPSFLHFLPSYISFFLHFLLLTFPSFLHFLLLH